MKSLFKVTLLATTMAFAFNATQVMAADAAAPAADATATADPAAKAPAPANVTSDKFKSSEDQAAYALGASLGRYMDNSLKELALSGVISKEEACERATNPASMALLIPNK